jgi:hypothetical protein
MPRTHSFIVLGSLMQFNEKSLSLLHLNLYVDCMPVDNLKPLDSEQVNRILAHALNIDVLRQNQSLDTSSLLLQYNLNHMRTLNQLTMVHLLKKQTSDIKSANPFSLDSGVFANAESVFPARALFSFSVENSFEDKVKAFKFASLWNKMEAINIMLQIQSEIYGLDKHTFFFTPEKTMRIEEFVMNQQTSSNSIMMIIKETWITAVTTSVKNNLKDVKKVTFYSHCCLCTAHLTRCDDRAGSTQKSQTWRCTIFPSFASFFCASIS